jgi:hypothetical protein
MGHDPQIDDVHHFLFHCTTSLPARAQLAERDPGLFQDPDFWNVRSLMQSNFASAYVRDAFKLLRECVKPALIVDGGQEGPGALGLAT